MPIGTIVGGGIQIAEADKALKELEAQETPTYGVSPELKSAYDKQKAAKGISAEEKAVMQSQIAEGQAMKAATRQRTGGGSLAHALKAATQFGDTAAGRKYVTAQARRRTTEYNQTKTIAGQMQAIRTLQNRADIVKRQMTERAIGAAHATGMENIMRGAEHISEVVHSAFGVQDGGADVNKQASEAFEYEDTAFDQRGEGSFGRQRGRYGEQESGFGRRQSGFDRGLDYNFGDSFRDEDRDRDQGGFGGGLDYDFGGDFQGGFDPNDYS